jgi:MoaA/NifB/PqqE/SkfB family radical SAM enzyme
MRKEDYAEQFLNNRKLNESEMTDAKIVLDSMPRILMMVLTSRCNLECIMCTRANPKKDLILPVDKAKQIISIFPYLEAIDWQGGKFFW